MLRKLGLVMLFVICLVACSPDQATVVPTQGSAPGDTPVPVPSATPAAAPVDTSSPAETALPPDTPVPEEMGPSAGGRIAFYSHRDGNIEIYTMGPDGSDQRRLTFNEYDDYSPSWSPDGSQIAFLSDREDPNPTKCAHDCFYQLYVINADGSGEHKLVETDFTVQHPDWHPDGTRISFDTEFNLQGDIYVVNADGSGLQLLIEDGFWADWSPDGAQVVFASKRDGNVELYVADADGGNQRRLTENGYLDYFPDWSPDGQRIAFARLEKKQIYVMNADGSNERQLTHQGNAENPSWSPDGTLITFQSSSGGNFDIYVLNVEEALQGGEGSAARRLTDHPEGDLWPSWGSVNSPVLPVQAERYLGQAPPGMDVQVFAPGIVSIEGGKEYKITFSPDLREILFTRRTPNGRDDRIWYARLENGVLTTPELAPFAHDSLEMDPSFAPDGNRVYFNSQRPLPGEGMSSTRFNVWFVDRTGDGWGEPQFLGSPINDYRPVYFSFADDGTLYFTNSNPREIWYAEWIDGQYAEAQRLPDEINDLPNVAHPAIAPDESYIIVDSYVQKGGRLVGSLYVSFKRADGSWTEALSMAEVLGASETDVYASARITPDGRYLFFERYLPETDRADIYWVGTKVIEALRDEALSAADDWPITVGLYVDAGAHSACTTAAANMFKWMGFNVERIRAADINEGDLSAIDLLYFAGGSAGPYQQDITAAGKEKIRQRIQAGGCFIGTCAGALFAGERAVWDGDADPGETLGLFPGTVEGPIPQIFAENGICQVNLEPHAITGATPEPVWILYYNSPFFQPNSGAAVDVIGRYDITGHPAIVASAYGQGRVVLTGPHPEWEEDDDRDGISYFDHFDDQGSEWDLMRQASLWCLRRMDG